MNVLTVLYLEGFIKALGSFPRLLIAIGDFSILFKSVELRVQKEEGVFFLYRWDDLLENP